MVGAEGKPLNGACMTSAGTGVSRVCDTCNFVDEKMAFLRDETKKRGFATVDGVHMGPCEIHKSHSHTISPDGSLFACPGFAGEALQSVGHIDGRQEDFRSQALRQFERLSAWEQCDDCAYIPVCAGGCTVAAHNELGDMYAPNCHKPSFEAGVGGHGTRCRARARPRVNRSGGVNEAQETRGNEENHDAAPLARGRGRGRLAISRLQRNITPGD